MHKTRRNRSLLFASFAFLDLLYHSIVRNIRVASGNASIGILASLVQNLAMLGIFFMMYTAIGLRGFAIRGDFVIFLLTGIFLLLTHNQAIMTVMGSGSPTAPMMQHAPMSTLIDILATAISGLYMQILSISIILFATHALRGGLEFYNPAGLLFPFFIAWASGMGVGIMFLSLKPFAPKAMPLIAMLYRRANMITSGKIIPANYMGAGMVGWFDWNPLFHAIDQARGAAFVNYVPRYSNMEYPVYFTLTIITIGLMIEFWIRKNVGESWGKRSVL